MISDDDNIIDISPEVNTAPGVDIGVYHDGMALVSLSRYRSITRVRVTELVKELALEDNPYDLTPEIVLLRALVIDYVNNYDDLVEALLNWNANESDDARIEKRRPNIQKIPEIKDAGDMIEKIGRMVGTFAKIQGKKSVTLESLNKIIESMGLIVQKFVRHGIERNLSATEIIRNIEREWTLIKI